MGEVLDKRRSQTDARLSDLQKQLAPAETVASARACVYLTGSVARAEAGRFSDLDLFIVGLEENKRRSLSRLDEIVLKAQLIQGARKLGFPDFSGDGQYLEHYTVAALCEQIGKPDDDARNTFTARLLLLLESRALLGSDVYNQAISGVIKEYWRDYEGHPNEFVPAFLANDIVRLWKTFCVNYEARSDRETEDARAVRKLMNYKLKHSRMLTCYSGLLFLLARFAEVKTVSPDDAVNMTLMSPTRRLEWLGEHDKNVMEPVQKLLSAYEKFLTETDQEKKSLLERFKDKDRAHAYMEQAQQFGDRMFDLLRAVGNNSRLYRFIVV